MKSRMALFWMLAAALASVLVFQSVRSSRNQARIETLQKQAEELRAQARVSEEKAGQLREEEARLRAKAAAAETELSKARQALATARTVPAPAAPVPGAPSAGPEARPSGGGPGEMFRNMLKDPEMRKAMEQQQRMGLEMLYGSLIKQLRLSPEEERKFKEIVIGQQMANVSQAGALFGGGADPGEAARRLGEEQRQRQEQLKELLGEERFARYEDYNQTAAERIMLEQMGRQIELTPDQSEQLLALFGEEKKNFQINLGGPAGAPSGADLPAVIPSAEALEHMIERQEQVNARVLERAGQLLAPEQIRALEPVLKSQIEMQRAGAKMARQMLGGGQNQEAP